MTRIDEDYVSRVVSLELIAELYGMGRWVISGATASRLMIAQLADVFQRLVAARWTAYSSFGLSNSAPTRRTTRLVVGEDA